MFFVLILALIPVSAAAFDVPPNDGFVTDTVGVLTPEQDAELERVLTDYRTQTSNEIAILIVGKLEGEAIAQVAVDVGRAWGVGSEEDDNGLLMVIAYEDRDIFIATGYGLEGALPDIVVKGVIDEDILPAFRDGLYYEGIQASIQSLQKHIGGEYTAERYIAEGGEDGAWPFLLFVMFLLFQWVAAAMARTKSWWAGGVVGGIAGLILAVLFSWWLSIPILVILGLIFDYILSKTGGGRGGRGGRGTWIGGGRGGFGGGGFGGFGGGSFGGGGAGGKW